MSAALPIGAAIRALREWRGWSQRELARRAADSAGHRTVSVLEAGRRGITVGTPPSGGLLERYAAALGVPASRIVRMAEEIARERASGGSASA